MSITPQTVLQQARQGNPDAIAALMNQQLQARGITARVTQQGDALHVCLESAQVLAPGELVAYIKKGITGLSLPDIHQLQVSGKQTGHPFADWTETIPCQIGPGDEGTTFDMATAGAASTAATPLGQVKPMGNGQASTSEQDFDLDNLEDSPGLDDLDFTQTDNSDDSLDLDLEAALGNTGMAVSDDLADLGLDTNDFGSSDADLAELDLDFGDTSVDSANAFDLNLGPDELQETTDELDAALSDLDMSDSRLIEDSWTGANATDGDLSLDLDAELNLTGEESVAATAGEDLDFDLDLEVPEAELGNLDFPTDEQSLNGNNLDIDFDLSDDNPDATDLHLDEEPSLDLDLDSSLPSIENTDFDLDPAPPSASIQEMDLDLAGTSGVEAPPDLALDFENDPVTPAPPDLDLNFDAPASVPEASDLDFDLDSQDELGEAPDLDLNLETSGGFTDSPELELDESLDFDLNQEASNQVLEDLDVTGDQDLQVNPELTFDTESAADLADLEFSGSVHEAADTELDLDVDALSSAVPPPETPIDLDGENLASSHEQDLVSDAQSLTLGDGLEGDLWTGDNGSHDLSTAESPTLPTADSDPDNLTHDIPWDDLEAETPNSAQTPPLTDQNDRATADIHQQSLDPGNPPADLETASDQGLAAAVHSLNEETSAPDSEQANLENFDPDFQSTTGAEPVDLMLSEELDMAEDDQGGEFDDFEPSADDAEEETHPQGSTIPGMSSEQARDISRDSGLGLAAAAAAAAPQSPIHKLLREDTFRAPRPQPQADSPASEELGSLTENEPAAEELDSLTGDDLEGITDSLAAAEPTPSPEIGLQPEDFPIFNSEPVEPEVEPSALEEPTAAGSGDAVSADTLDLETNPASVPSGGSGVEDLTVTSDDFPLDEDENFEPMEPTVPFAGETSANPEPFPKDDDDMVDDLVNEDAANGFVADVDGEPGDPDQAGATDEFTEEMQDGSDEPVSTSVNLTEEDLDNLDNGSKGSAINSLVGIGLGVVVLGLIGILFSTLLNNRRPTEPVAEPPVEMPAAVEGELETPVAEESEGTGPEAAAPETTPPAVTEPEAESEPAPAGEAPAEAQYFREAVNAAQNAANLAQTASTGAEWQAVADSWSRAIELMKQVPESDPNYATAQQKVVDYQPNLEYAQQNAERL